MLVYDQATGSNGRKRFEPSVGWAVKGVLGHKLLIVTAIVVGTTASIGAYVSMTPLYEASTLLLVGQSTGGDDWETAKRTSEMVASHARIAESEEVLRDAIQHIGLEKLNIETATKTVGLGEKLRSLILGTKIETPVFVSPIETAVFNIGRSISISPEARSNVIKISFKHPDPVIAAQFANTLAQSFIDRQIKLSDKPGTLDFLRIQKSRFDAEVELRSFNFEAFTKKQKTYSIVDQRTLLLKRASEIAAALSITRTSLAEKQGQKSALAAQLRLLKPVTLSPFVSSLVDTLGNDDRGANVPRPTPQFNERSTGGGDPPLLMVRVYQDEMVALFKLNSDIKGLYDLSEQQQREVNTINAELATLIENQSEFEKLKREVGLATFNAELYAKRAVAEQIESDLRTAKLTNIKVIQPALVPMQLGFPNVRVFLGVGSVLGMCIGVGTALLLESAHANASAAQGGGTGESGSDHSKPTQPRNLNPASKSMRRAQRRNAARATQPNFAAHGATGFKSPTQAGPQASSGGAKIRNFKKPALIGLACLCLVGMITAATVNDTRAADQLLKWARASWLITVQDRV